MSAARPAAQLDSRTRSDIEQRLVDLWREVLAVEDVGLDDPFFEVGGDSLLLGILRDRMTAVFGVMLPAATLLELPTIRLLATRVAEGDSVAAEPANVSGFEGRRAPGDGR